MEMDSFETPKRQLIASCKHLKFKVAKAADCIPSAAYLIEIRHFNYKIDNITQKNNINKCLFSLDICGIYDIINLYDRVRMIPFE